MKVYQRKQLLWDDVNQEAYYYTYRSGKKRNYSYRHTLIWEVWEDAFKEAGITKEDIKNGKVYIENLPGYKCRFVIVEGKF